MASLVRSTLDAYEALKAARARYQSSRTPTNFFSLMGAEFRFKRSNRLLALAAIAADSEKLAA